MNRGSEFGINSDLPNHTFSPMLITDIFRVHSGLGIPKKVRGACPYVAASFKNNGVVGYVDKARYPGGWLSLVKDGDGGAGKCFYQPAPFWPSNHVFALEPKISGLDSSALLCVAASITYQCFPKYSRGYAINEDRLSRQKILIPVTKDDAGKQVVDWERLTRFGKKLIANAKAQARIVRESRLIDVDALPTLNFEPILIMDVFDSMKTSAACYDRVAIQSGTGKNIYLTQTRSSNSVAEIIPHQRISAEPGNCITMTLKTQATFYQPSPFYTAQNFLIFRHKSLNAYNGMILVTALRRVAEKFSWGYGVSMGRLGKISIMVPVIADDSGRKIVDWEGMTEYGRVLRARAEQAMGAALANTK